MPFLEAVRLALSTIRVQKLKSFFTLIGVTIGVMFLIAVAPGCKASSSPRRLRYAVLRQAPFVQTSRTDFSHCAWSACRHDAALSSSTLPAV